jgi:histidinol-phosphate aminotransferase
MPVRKNVLNIRNYEPGKPIEEVQRELGKKEVIKMASNENPLGPSPRAVAAIKENLKNLNRYPDANCYYLKQRLAAKLGVGLSDLIIGNGSDEIISIALRAFLNEGEEVIIADTTFLIYKIAAQIANAKITVAPMKDFKYDLKAMQSAISEKTKIIFIANPDNPTGTYCTESEVATFMKAVPKNVIVFFDEAYYEFGKQQKDFPDTMKYLSGGRNVIISRTFSKVYGLSGIRVGYGISSARLVGYMDKVREPFNVNLLAQAAARAALDDTQFLKKTLSNTKKGKEFLCGEFDKLGLGYVPSATNFILVNIKKPCKEIFNKLLASGVIIRDMAAWGLDTYIRVTVGTPGENKKFIQALRRIL